MGWFISRLCLNLDVLQGKSCVCTPVSPGLSTAGEGGGLGFAGSAESQGPREPGSPSRSLSCLERERGASPPSITAPPGSREPAPTEGGLGSSRGPGDWGLRGLQGRSVTCSWRDVRSEHLQRNSGLLLERRNKRENINSAGINIKL